MLPSVKAARERLLGGSGEGGLNHEYLSILGLPEFRRATCELVFGGEEGRVGRGEVRELFVFSHFALHVQCWFAWLYSMEEGRTRLIDGLIDRSMPFLSITAGATTNLHTLGR